MIQLFTGTPGSGKSLDAAGRMRYALNKPRGEQKPVIANFQINTTIVKRPDAFTFVDNSEITPEWLVNFADDFWMHTDRHFSEDYLLLVLDEVQIIFNNRNWMSKGRQGRNDSRLDWVEFMSQHRKYGYEIILIAQSAKMIDNQFRYLCDYEINHRKVSTMGMVGSAVGALFANRLFMRVKYLFQTNERLGMQWSLARSKDMAMYDSYARLKKVQETS